MITLADFKTICRLCLSKDDKRLVNLFSKTLYDENGEILVSEVVESFCKIKLLKDDGLPGQICHRCLRRVSSLHKFRIVSLESNRLLYEIINAQASLLNNDDSISTSEIIKDFEMKFIDPEVHLESESLKESEIKNRLVAIERDTNEAPEANKSKIKKKKISGAIRKVSCEMCGKLVPTYFIEFHLNLHRDVRPYKCEVEDCGKYFVAPTHAKNHYTKVHVNGIIRPYKCDICGRGFNQKSSLNTHKTYHFDPQIPCSICGQFYRNKRAIKKHLLVHSGERKFSCSECQKSFQTKSTLRVHMRTHTLEKPYPCSDCTKSFAYKCLLKGHTAKYHPK